MPRLSFALVALGLLPLAAPAQSCPTCGPRLANSRAAVYTDVECDRHGVVQNPRFESRYIKQFCQPHISPSSCFGYFKPQITPWGRACPNYACGGEAMPGTSPVGAVVAGPAVAPVVIPAPNPSSGAAPKADARPAEKAAEKADPDAAPLPNVAPPLDLPRPPSVPRSALPVPPAKLEPVGRGELPPLPEPEIPVAPTPGGQSPAVPVALPRF